MAERLLPLTRYHFHADRPLTFGTDFAPGFVVAAAQRAHLGLIYPERLYAGA